MAVEMPPRIAKLERDKRGYPIPWNVLRGVGNVPLFTVNDEVKAWQALYEQRCPICGEQLERWAWFVGGPLSAFDPNGWYFDLPTHEECAEYALATCPYLAAPKYLGRLDIIDPAKLPPEAAMLIDDTIISERPEVFVMVAGCGIEVKLRDVLLPYVRPKRPLLEARFWRHGQRISEAEGMRLIKPLRIRRTGI